jgi:hypothetical protein
MRMSRLLWIGLLAVFSQPALAQRFILPLEVDGLQLRSA